MRPTGPIAQFRLERTPDKREVDGSIPSRPTTRNSDIKSSGFGNQDRLKSAILCLISVIGGVAQLGERLPCTQEVIGSIPFTSTRVDLLIKFMNPE